MGLGDADGIQDVQPQRRPQTSPSPSVWLGAWAGAEDYEEIDSAARVGVWCWFRVELPPPRAIRRGVRLGLMLRLALTLRQLSRPWAEAETEAGILMVVCLRLTRAAGSEG